MKLIALLCALLGLAGIAFTLRQPKPIFSEEYGRRLISQTQQYLGPDSKLPRMKSRLACASCHIDAGVAPGNLSLATANNRYPRISPRGGGPESMQQRINGCMTRSMNGTALAEDSAEMLSMVAYIKVLAEDDAGTEASRKKAHEPALFKTPARAADLKHGEAVFANRCAACHGKQGAGVPASKDALKGYIFPPLWGDNSFNDGAGMHRLLTAAKFVKAKMPLGKADLDDDSAFDVAAYFNSKPRPRVEGLEKDYPDRAKKPIDTAYGPYADAFPAEQHQFGPYPPIEAFYKSRK